MSAPQFPPEKHCHSAVEIAASAPCFLCGSASDGSGSEVCLLKTKWQILSR